MTTETNTQTPNSFLSPEAEAVTSLTVATEELLTGYAKQQAAGTLPEGITYTEHFDENGDWTRQAEIEGYSSVLNAVTKAETPSIVSYRQSTSSQSGSGARYEINWSSNDTTVSEDTRGMYGEKIPEQTGSLGIKAIQARAKTMAEKAALSNSTAELEPRSTQRKRGIGQRMLGLLGHRS
jgi:hypothetical protein